MSSITDNIAGDDLVSKTLDMEGREAAVDLIEAMAEGFKEVEVTNPKDLETFLTGVTGSVKNIMDVSWKLRVNYYVPTKYA